MLHFNFRYEQARQMQLSCILHVKIWMVRWYNLQVAGCGFFSLVMKRIQIRDSLQTSPFKTVLQVGFWIIRHQIQADYVVKKAYQRGDIQFQCLLLSLFWFARQWGSAWYLVNIAYKISSTSPILQIKKGLTMGIGIGCPTVCYTIQQYSDSTSWFAHINHRGHP